MIAPIKPGTARRLGLRAPGQFVDVYMGTSFHCRMPRTEYEDWMAWNAETANDFDRAAFERRHVTTPPT